MIPTEKEMLMALEQRHGKKFQQRFSKAVVAVCGLGGLGSNAAIALARAGIGKLILIDFDKVDITNLHRQQYKTCQVGMYKTEALSANLREIAPYIMLEVFNVRIDEDNIARLLINADIICEAFDEPQAKAMLANKVLEDMPEKYLVSASGMAGFGNANEIRTRKITDKFYICGDEVSEVNDGIGLISSRVMVCAAHQAHIILRIIAGIENNERRK